jgi:uncharacterized protein (DUF433 family)
MSCSPSGGGILAIMTLTIATERPPLRVEPDGTARVGGTRITLDTVVGAYNGGASAEQIVQQFESLTLPDVCAVMAYYLRHGAEIDAYLQSRRRKADEIRHEIEADPTTQRIRDRLRARHGGKN